jgi:hypothetical protein
LIVLVVVDEAGGAYAFDVVIGLAQPGTSAMSVAQLATLAAVTLIPLNDSCTADGFRYRDVTVYDMDGTSRSYRDTGCDYLMVEGARGMLDSVTPDFSLFPDEMGTTCAPRP